MPNRIAVDGPVLPRFPRSLIHPLGPIFPKLPKALRRHLLHLWHHRQWGNFRNPSTFPEKMQWRILNDHRTILGVATDKLAANEYARRAAAHAGLPLRIPETYWVGTDVRELQGLAAQLPSRWVLKPNHSSGRFRILDTAQEPVDWEELIRAGDRWMQPDEEEVSYGHPGYGAARKLLLAEERIGAAENPPATLRTQVACGRIISFSYSFGSMHPSSSVPWRRYRYNPSFERVVDSKAEGAAPLSERSRIDELGHSERVQLTRTIQTLAEGLDQVRVDLYVEDQIWFGELTMYSGSGLSKYEPAVAREIAEYWVLPDLDASDPREPEWREQLAFRPKGTLQGSAR